MSETYTQILLLENGKGGYKVSAKAPDSETLLEAVTEIVKVSGAMLGFRGLDMAALIASKISEEGEDGTTDTG